MAPALCRGCGAHFELLRGRIICHCGEEIPPGARQGDPECCDKSTANAGPGCGVCDSPAFQTRRRELPPPAASPMQQFARYELPPRCLRAASGRSGTSRNTPSSSNGRRQRRAGRRSLDAERCSPMSPECLVLLALSCPYLDAAEPALQPPIPPLVGVTLATACPLVDAEQDTVPLCLGQNDMDSGRPVSIAHQLAREVVPATARAVVRSRLDGADALADRPEGAPHGAGLRGHRPILLGVSALVTLFLA